MPMRCGIYGNVKYTSYADADKLINSFVEEAEKDSIWVSVDAKELKDTPGGNKMCVSLKRALNAAKDNCIRCTPPKDRFIRLRSREIQNQMLVRIEYSCGDEGLQEVESNCEDLSKYVETAGGYYKQRVENDVGEICIAFPSRTN